MIVVDTSVIVAYMNSADEPLGALRSDIAAGAYLVEWCRWTCERLTSTTMRA